MKIDIQDILFWMDAIRNSEDRYRTLESFWKGQINSKIWLIDNLRKVIDQNNEHTIFIHGGWNGVLASLLFNSDLKIKHISSLDLDPRCEETARTINKRQEIEGKFKSITANMCDYSYQADVVINTSCEHISQAQYDLWLSNVPEDSLVVIQTNDYYELEEHINCVSSLEEFKNNCKLRIIFSDVLSLPKYNRFMIIGYKHA